MIQEIKDRFFELAGRSGGTTCPCCGKHGQIYRRKFNSVMARSLIILYKAGPNFEWINLIHEAAKTHGQVIGDYGKLEWWGLAEREESDDGVATGRYRLTQKGLDFLFNRIEITSHAREYRSNVREFIGGKINIRKAIGDHFDYHELMSA